MSNCKETNTTHTMTEQQLKNHSFKKIVVSPLDAGDDKGFYYYELCPAANFCLVSNTNIEAESKGAWVVYGQEDDITFDRMSDVINVIQIVNRLTNKCTTDIKKCKDTISEEIKQLDNISKVLDRAFVEVAPTN